MKKSIAAIALAGSIAFASAVPAMADYTAPNSNEQGQVDNGNVNDGEQFNFSGQGFNPGESISVEVQQTGGPQAAGGGSSTGVSMAVPGKITLPLAPQTFTTKANGSGAFSLPLTISSAGTYTLTATGLTSGHKVSASVTVKAASATGTGLANTGGGTALANTGADASLVLWSLVGAGALAAGVTSVVVVRRRAKAEVA